MSKIFNGNNKGQSIATAIGLISFDENGIAEVNDEEMAEKLLQLDGYKRPDGEGAPKQPQSEPKKAEVENNSSEEENTQETEENTSDNEEENVEEEKSEGEELTEEVLTTKNVPQLRKIAKDNDIDLNGATKKDEIIAIILGSMK